mmetsp:Transcript_55629/g.148372  ORF Transcript_55629/g.148372 Transcript_55629/m.148372 type:complete len:236 (+) Transcript_55629:391-1098(+)
MSTWRSETSEERRSRLRDDARWNREQCWGAWSSCTFKFLGSGAARLPGGHCSSLPKPQRGPGECPGAHLSGSGAPASTRRHRFCNDASHRQQCGGAPTSSFKFSRIDSARFARQDFQLHPRHVHVERTCGRSRSFAAILGHQCRHCIPHWQTSRERRTCTGLCHGSSWNREQHGRARTAPARASKTSEPDAASPVEPHSLVRSRGSKRAGRRPRFASAFFGMYGDFNALFHERGL